MIWIYTDESCTKEELREGLSLTTVTRVLGERYSLLGTEIMDVINKNYTKEERLNVLVK